MVDNGYTMNVNDDPRYLMNIFNVKSISTSRWNFSFKLLDDLTIKQSIIE